MEEMEFKLGDRFFSQFRRLAFGLFLPILVVAILAAVFITSSREEMAPATMVVMGVVLTLALGFGGWKGVQRQEASLRELRIRLDEGSIRRSQPGLPEIAIPRERITRIVRTPGKGMTVFGPGREEILGIPETLEGFGVVESTLEGWRPFEVRKPGPASGIVLLAVLGTLAAFVTLNVSTNKIVITVCGGALIALMAYSAIAARGSRHLDQRTKRAFWFTPVLIIVIAVQIWVAWTR